MKKKWIAAAVLASFALLIQGCAAGKAVPEPSALAQEQKPSIPAQETEPSDLTKEERPLLLVQGPRKVPVQYDRRIQGKKQ